MKVNEFIELTKFTTMANLTIKSNDVIIKHLLNAGLSEMYSMFDLDKRSFPVTLTDEENYIELPSNCDRVHSLDDYMVNVDYDGLIIEQPNLSTLRVYNGIGLTNATVYYFTKAPTIEDLSSTDNLPIPDSLLDCLSAYIGYKAHISVKADVKEENNAYYMRFIAAIDRVAKYHNLTINRGELNKRLDRRVF